MRADRRRRETGIRAYSFLQGSGRVVPDEGKVCTVAENELVEQADRAAWARSGRGRAVAGGDRGGDARSAAHCGSRQDGSGAWIRARRRSAGHGRASLPIPARSDRPCAGDRGRQLNLQRFVSEFSSKQSRATATSSSIRTRRRRPVGAAHRAATLTRRTTDARELASAWTAIRSDRRRHW